MDALVSVAFQEVAAEGPLGCSLRNLWKWLQNPCKSAGFPMDTLVKQALWKLLLSSGCLTYEVPGSGCVDSTDGSIQDFMDAEKLNVNIIASEDLRESFLGACNVRHCDTKLSTIQRSILERLGQARTNGVTQYQIGKEFGITGNKLFYIIKSLESRGLLVRQSSIYRGERPIATNLIHLKRFSKSVKLGFHQRFEICNASRTTFDDDDDISVTEGEANQVCNLKDTLINDDLPSLKEACRKIEEADNKVLVMSDLKVSLGYRFTRGHREWRRILNRLVIAGLVEVFDAKVEKKVRPCIRLLKPFDVKAFFTKSNTLTGDEMGFDLNFKGAKRGKVTEQVAELSMNRQIYDTIKQGGSIGVTVTEVFNRLGIINKKNYYRLTNMVSMYGLHLQVKTYKRSTQYRVCVREDYSNPQVDAGCANENKHKQDPWVQSRGKLEGEKEEISLSSALAQMPENMLPPAEAISGKPAEDKTPVMESEMVPYREAENSEANEFPVRICAPAPFASQDTMPIAFSKCNQRVVALSSAHTQREMQIMEKLEKEKFILRSELHKLLEDLDDRKNTLLDRKTVARNLQKLQKEGRCKCLLVNLPGVSNYGQIRTVDVVLLPSIEISPDVMTQIYERQRAFDKSIRHESATRLRKSKPEDIPSLTGVQRMPKAEIVEKGRTLQENGFISPKLVRSRLLHQFLWLYISGLRDENTHLEEYDAVNGGGVVFSLLVAIQSMPLESFLQVIGSTKHIKGLAERCKRGMRLSDLPRKESESLLDLNASGRLAWLVDILRRLKLLRIVMIPPLVKDHPDKSAQAGVAYALELNPYIDEPDFEPPSTISAHVLNLGPSPRHYFQLSSKESLEEYWKSLEYFYRGSESQIARRIFPGSTVPELFGVRSWSCLRVMSMEQRSKLQERIGLHDTRRLPYEECVRIARELNLSLDQVLGVSYEKNQRIKQKEMQPSKEDPLNSSQINIALGTRSQTKKRSASSGGIPEESARLEIRKRRNQNSLDFRTKCAEQGSILADKDNDIGNPEDDDCNEDLGTNRLPQILVRKFRPLRKKKYMWTDEADRVLVACYTRQRAILGSRYNRVEWSSISGLPAPADTCRRRIISLKMIPTVRKAMMEVCNLLGTRYTKHLRLHADPGQSFHNDLWNTMAEESLERKVSDSKVYSWDDFEDPILSAAINDIMRRKNVVRSTSSKKSIDTSSIRLKSSQFAASADHDRIKAGDVKSSLPATGTDYYTVEAIPENVLQASDEIVPGKCINTHYLPNMKSATSARARPNRFNVRKKMQRPTTLKDISSDEIIRKSAGVAMAVELIKLVFLNSAVESEVSQILVDALRRCKEADIFTAFRFLKDQALVAVGDDCHAFVLSPKFYQNSTSSPFVLTTSDESKKFEKWLRDQKTCLDEDWATLAPEPQWGELFQLFSNVLSGQLYIAPFLPETGIGEKDPDETTRKRKRDFPISEQAHVVTKAKTVSGCEEGGFGQRRERGFPGIEVKVHTAVISFESMLMMRSEKHALLDSYNFSTLEGSDQMNVPEILDLEQEKTSIESNPQYHAIANEDKDELGNFLRPEDLDSHSLDLHIADDNFEVPMLEQVHAAILSAGETGIKIGDSIEIIRAEGKVTVEITISYARALHSLGLAREVMAFDHLRVVAAPYYERYFLHVPKSGNAQEGLVEMVPILPWLEADGKENAIRRSALNRRIMGIVMLNPGILEESIIQQVDVLNPMSCQNFLQLMVLDGYLFIRTRMEYDSPEIPFSIQMVSPERSRQRKLVQRRHYFGNPKCSFLL